MYATLAQPATALPLALLRNPGVNPGPLRSLTPAYRDASLASTLLRHVLDALNLGLLLVDAHSQVLHANQAAHLICKPGALVELAGPRLHLLPSHRQQLLAALRAASRQQWSMLVLRQGAACLSVGVVPMGGDDSHPDLMAMLVIDAPGQPSGLALQFFCQAHGLTSAESAVLLALCQGMTPSQIAAAGGVAISTVRSQIATVRAKAHAASIGHLMQLVGALPPMASAAGAQARHDHWHSADPRLPAASPHRVNSKEMT